MPIQHHRARRQVGPADGESWDPITPASEEMKAQAASGKPMRLEATISWQWSRKMAQAAWGYGLIARVLEGNDWVTVAKKDWKDDSIVPYVRSLSVAKLAATTEALDRVIWLTNALGAPPLGVYVPDTQVSVVITPIEGRSPRLSDAQKPYANQLRAVVRSYESESRIFCRGARKSQKRLRDDDGRVTAYAQRYGHLNRRLRALLYPDGYHEDSFWIDLAEVGRIIAAVKEATGKAPPLGQALCYYVVRAQGREASFLGRYIGVGTGQINRAAATLAKRVPEPMAGAAE